VAYSKATGYQFKEIEPQEVRHEMRKLSSGENFKQEPMKLYDG